jgi:hypothetical protein
MMPILPCYYQPCLMMTVRMVWFTRYTYLKIFQAQRQDDPGTILHVVTKPELTRDSSSEDYDFKDLGLWGDAPKMK